MGRPGSRRNAIRFLYTGLRVRRLDRSIRFYRNLGFRIRRRGTMEHGGVWVHLTIPGQPHRLELNYYPKGNRFHEPFRRGTELDHLAFVVGDVEEWVRRAVRRGGRRVAVVSETHERLVYVRDPDGVWLEFIGPIPRRRPKRRATA